MRALPAITMCLLALTPVARAETPRPTGDPAVVGADAKLEQLFNRSAPIHGGLTEGPAVAPDGSIYFSDIPFGTDKGMILRFDPKTRNTTVFTDDSHKSNGLKFDAAGYLLACEGADGGGRGVSRWDVKTRERKILTNRFMGQAYNSPNDLAIDLKGRVYFTDPRYLGPEPRELERQAVYRIDRDGTVREITHEPEKPNGIVLSPDQKTLYVIDHNNGTDRIDPNAPPPKKGAMKVYSFALDDDGLVKGPVKTFIDFGTEDGADGMAVDARGNVYLAVRSHKRPGIWVLDPSGKELAYIPTGPSQSGTKEPTGIPSNCCFGLGDEIKVLYVTVDTGLYRIRLQAEGWHIPFEK
jgi:gluconolactonase